VGISTPDDFELTTDVLPDALLLLSASGSIVAADSAAQDFFSLGTSSRFELL
jgi:hypothetical protein